jgi:hypothetical protein
VPDQDCLFGVNTADSLQDVSSRDRDVRAGVDEAPSEGAHHRQDLGHRQVRPAGELDSHLLLELGRRLREEVVFFEVVLPALARLGASDPEVRPTAAGALPGHDSIPKAASETLRREGLVQFIVWFACLQGQSTLAVELFFRLFRGFSW